VNRLKNKHVRRLNRWETRKS